MATRPVTGPAGPEPSRPGTSRHQPVTDKASAPAQPALYTAAEAAAILRVKTSWLERQAAGRRVPFTMLGGGYRFTAAHLAAIVQLHEQLPDIGGEHRVRQRRASGSRKPGADIHGPSSAPLLPRQSRRRSRGIDTKPAA